MESALKWFYDKKGKVTYSMEKRNGPSSYDCSSSVYYALIQSGHLPVGTRIGNTDSLFGNLERSGWVRVVGQADGFIPTQRGDVFIWGKRGASGGAAGHTGMFTDADNIIHCAYGYNGITITNHDWLWGFNGSPEVTVYRYVGVAATAVSNVVDQIVEVGSYIRFDHTFVVNDVQHIGGIWQVRTDELCEGGFTWEDNGIPAEPLVEVDGDGYATADQELAVGARYKIPGKYRVLDVGFDSNMWLALIEWNGLKFWIDLEDATEIGENDSGTPAPKQRPTPATPPPVAAPNVPAAIQEPTPVSENPDTDTSEQNETPTIPEKVPAKPIEQTPPIINNPKEDKVMAFNKAEQKELKVATDKAQDFANVVAGSDEVKSIVSSISKKTKLAVYIVGDGLIGAGIITPNLAVVLGWGDLVRIIALSSLFTALGGFLLTMFGIYKSGSKE